MVVDDIPGSEKMRGLAEEKQGSVCVTVRLNLATYGAEENTN